MKIKKIKFKKINSSIKKGILINKLFNNKKINKINCLKIKYINILNNIFKNINNIITNKISLSRNKNLIKINNIKIVKNKTLKKIKYLAKGKHTIIKKKLSNINIDYYYG